MGGAALMAVEHASRGKRGAYGAAPQVGVPLGLLLASGVMALMTIIAPGDAFLEWGWRIPFLLSVVLILVGWYVRRRVQESPVFAEIARRKEQTRMPILSLLRKRAGVVVAAALVFAGSNASGYMTTGYIQNYATDPEGALQLERGAVLWAVAGSSVMWLVTTWASGTLSDRIGRKSTLIIGWISLMIGVVALFPLADLGSIWTLLIGLLILSVGIGFAYGPISSYFAELFPASVRFSGVSIAYALGAILGGAFSAMIAAALVQATGTSWSIVAYLFAMATIGLAATVILRDRTGTPLGPDHEAQQSASPFIWRRG